MALAGLPQPLLEDILEQKAAAEQMRLGFVQTDSALPWIPPTIGGRDTLSMVTATREATNSPVFSLTVSHRSCRIVPPHSIDTRLRQLWETPWEDAETYWMRGGLQLLKDAVLSLLEQHDMLSGMAVTLYVGGQQMGLSGRTDLGDGEEEEWAGERALDQPAILHLLRIFAGNGAV